MVLKKVCYAILGGISWKVLHQKYCSDRYVFFPSFNMEYNLWGILMLHSFIEKENYKSVTAIAANNRIITMIKRQRIEEISYKLISSRQMEQYMCYYALRDVSHKWTVVSTQIPYDTGAERLLGRCGITYRDIVYYDIYGFSDERIICSDEQAVRKGLITG